VRDKSPSLKETVENTIDVIKEVQSITSGHVVVCQTEIEAPPKKKKSKFFDYVKVLFHHFKND
jgi:hypothetical protein